MKLLNFFRRPPRIGDATELGRFIDDRAAFVIQKGIYEYSRARAGHYAKVMFNEPFFLEAIERSRWRAFPLGLAMVGEIAVGVLETESKVKRGWACEFVHTLALTVFDRYPVPDALGKDEWAAERDELSRRMGVLKGQARRRSFEIPDEYSKHYFDLMPIHKNLRARDFPTTVNYLKMTLTHIHVELTDLLDADAFGKSYGQSERAAEA